MKANCKHCGAEFEEISSQVKAGRGKYCSRSCANKDRAVKRLCSICGVTMQGYNKTCSVGCCKELHRKNGDYEWTPERRERLKSSISGRNYRGENNPKWRGGRINRPDGRVAVFAPGNPNATLYGGTHILEYRLLAEQKIGRYLRKNEIVHHVDGDVTNNGPDNLEVTTQSQHAKLESYRRDKITGRYCPKQAQL